MATPEIPRQYLMPGDAPQPRTLVDILRETADLHPDSTGIDDGEVELDRAEMVADVEAGVRWLAARQVGLRIAFPLRGLSVHDEQADLASSEAAPTPVIANSGLSRGPAAGAPPVRGRLEPYSTWMETLQIGECGFIRCPRGRSRYRQTQMMKPLLKLFDPYPLASSYTIAVSSYTYEASLEAGVVSISSDNLCGDTRDHKRLFAHEIARPRSGQRVSSRRRHHISQHKVPARYAKWLWSEHVGRLSANELTLPCQHRRLTGAAHDVLLMHHGANDMFDNRYYRRNTIVSLRVSMDGAPPIKLTQDWTSRDHRGTLVTGGLTGATADPFRVYPGPLWDAWLYVAWMPLP